MATTLAAGAAGLIVGCPVALLWRLISMRMGQIDFWPSCRRLTRSLLCTVDAREFRAHYGELLLLLGRYLARNVLLTAGASLPVILFVLFVAPAAQADGYWGAACTALVPMPGGPEASAWSASNGPEVIFYAGLSLASSAGVFVLRMRSR
jgi:hypothetical protein